MYIRTKDGRILDFDKLNEVSKLSIDMAEEPIRESENIEDLCDEFVICLKNTIPYTVDTFQRHELLRDRAKLFKFYGTDAIFGAIWTDKGLIYVAKMNYDGKLELI